MAKNTKAAPVRGLIRNRRQLLCFHFSKYFGVKKLKPKGGEPKWQ